MNHKTEWSWECLRFFNVDALLQMPNVDAAADVICWWFFDHRVTRRNRNQGLDADQRRDQRPAGRYGCSEAASFQVPAWSQFLLGAGVFT